MLILFWKKNDLYLYELVTNRNLTLLGETIEKDILPLLGYMFMFK